MRNQVRKTMCAGGKTYEMKRGLCAELASIQNLNMCQALVEKLCSNEVNTINSRVNGTILC